MKYIIILIVVFMVVCGCTKKTRYEPLYGKWKSDKKLSLEWYDSCTNKLSMKRQEVEQITGHSTVCFFDNGKGKSVRDEYILIKDGAKSVKPRYLEDFVYRINNVVSNRIDITTKSDEIPYFSTYLFFQDPNVFWIYLDNPPGPIEYFRRIE